MEDFIASLSLEEAEEESIQLRVESSDSETSYANYFVGVFLTSSVSRITAAWRSRWLVEDRGGKVSNYGNSMNNYEWSNLRDLQSIVSQGTNKGFPSNILYFAKEKSNNLLFPGPIKASELAHTNNAVSHNYDEEMATLKEENNPIRHVDRLKRPRFQSNTLGVFANVDSNEASSILMQGFHTEKIKSKCGFQNGINVDSDGRSGGFSMGWKNDFNVSFRSYSRRYIDIMIDEDRMVAMEVHYILWSFQGKSNVG
ncbi:hypothetical protein Golob_024842, partial [Gossypium lobatum]|nr:hypothetical protein [Gossypium lobatum]